MNAVSPMPRARPLRKTFAAWEMNDRGYEAACQPLAADNLDEAVKLMTPHVAPIALARVGNDPFVILETDETAREGRARHMLHFYMIKVRNEWRSIGPLGSTAKAGVPYAVHMGSLPMNAFEPRRQFDAHMDCPGNGHQPGESRLIEVRL
jgi:hypothetical protein